MGKTPKAKFQPKSDYQKYSCLFCPEYASLEAVFGKAAIRCCKSDKCKKQAEELALALGK